MYVDYKELGKRIAQRRKELGLKQAEVNEMAGLSDKYLSNIERATSILSLDVFMKLCDVLQTTPDRLLLGSTTAYLPQNFDAVLLEKAQNMTPKQKKITLSLMNWVIKEYPSLDGEK